MDVIQKNLMQKKKKKKGTPLAYDSDAAKMFDLFSVGGWRLN
jgi:hypothetical protein